MGKNLNSVVIQTPKIDYSINIHINLSALRTKNHQILIDKYLKEHTILTYAQLLLLFSSIKLSKFEVEMVKKLSGLTLVSIVKKG